MLFRSIRIVSQNVSRILGISITVPTKPLCLLLFISFCLMFLKEDIEELEEFEHLEHEEALKK